MVFTSYFFATLCILMRKIRIQLFIFPSVFSILILSREQFIVGDNALGHAALLSALLSRLLCSEGKVLFVSVFIVISRGRINQ